MRVPERRENRVRESEDEDVLRGFFAQKMIDAVGLLFGERVADDSVELARRGEIGAERFLDDYAGPAPFAGFI